MEQRIRSEIRLSASWTSPDTFVRQIPPSHAYVIDIGADDLEWSPVKRQHFFKVLIGDFTRRLRIPPKFVKHIDIGKEAARKMAMLEGPTGRTWYVTIEKTTDGMFFTDGWSKFVQDHSLKEHEFLVFRYNGSMHFSLLIFDTTACEREDFDLCNGR